MDNRLDLLTNARTNLETLANGYDPVSGENLPDDAILNSARLSRCFGFVAGVLSEVIENGGNVIRVVKSDADRRNLPDFAITKEEINNIELSAEPVQIRNFCEKINGLIDQEKMRRLNVTAFGKWLAKNGYLAVELLDGKENKIATPKGESVGISTELRSYGERRYYALTYNIEAQRFLLEHLAEIIEISNGRGG